MSTAGKEAEKLLQDALTALKKLYQEFDILFSYGEIRENPNKHDELIEMIASFGPMPCRIMPVTAEKLADIIEDAITGNLE